MNIQEANGLLLRPAMTILADVQQTSELPQNVSANNVENLPTHARITDTAPITRIMDLTGDGFLNDGNAMPVSSGSEKYGYISMPTNSSGHWVNPPSITMTCRSEWDIIGILVQDLDGNEQEIEFENITWSGGTCTLTFTEFEPNKRMYITAIHLGKTFHFGNDDLISLTADLRGVNTSLDEGGIELEMSSVELSAYCGEGADRWINVFASMDKSSPCRISMGYPEDSVTRAFYVSEQPNYDATTKVLTVRMADATQMLDEAYGGKYVSGTTANVVSNYYNTIKEMLTDSGIYFEEYGTVPSGSGSGTSNLFFINDSKRNIIADAVTLFRDEDTFAITYRDGGIPQLIAGQTNVPTWEINEADVAEFTTDIEYIVRDYSASIINYSVSGTAEEVASLQGAISGEEYILECSDPVYSISSATKGTATLITPYAIKFVCTSSGDATVTGKKIIADTTSQFKTSSVGKGISVTLGDLQFVNAIVDGGTVSLTKEAIESLLHESNLKHNFKWRGNPHWQTHDHILMHMIDGTAKQMTLLSQTFTFEGGGLVCECSAREGWF